MIRPLIQTIKRIATGASTPDRAVEISTEIMPHEAGDDATVSFRKVAARDLAASVALPPSADTGADIDIWVLPHSAVPQIADEDTVLDADELAHASTIRHDANRARYIAVRVLLRRALSQRVGDRIAAADWRFEINEFGKPQLVPGQATLSFSITHAETLSVIAVAANSTIGVDAERVDGARVRHLPVELLSQNERSGLAERSMRQRCGDFFRLWTLKEAYTKALGRGMSHEFSKLDFCARTARLRSAVQEGDNPLFGILNLSHLGHRHLLTVCMLGSNLAALAASRKSIFIVGAAA